MNNLPFRPAPSYKVTVRFDRAAEDLFQICQDLAEIFEAVPPWMEPEARPAARRIVEKIKSWIEVKDGK